MIEGHFRDGFPRISLDLPGLDGKFTVEFVVDTGFDGDLSLPPNVIHRLEAVYTGHRRIIMADLTPRTVAYYEIVLTWQGQERLVEVMVTEGRPLLGTAMMEDNLLQIEITNGGSVLIELL